MSDLTVVLFLMPLVPCAQCIPYHFKVCYSHLMLSGKRRRVTDETALRRPLEYGWVICEMFVILAFNFSITSLILDSRELYHGKVWRGPVLFQRDEE